MKRINCVKVLFLMTLLLGFTACENDDAVFDNLIGRTWIGDLGFNYRDYPVESGLKFNANGFATDDQYYFPEDGGGFAVSLPVRWKLEYGALVLDYGNKYPLFEIRGVYISGPYLKGRLYVDGVDDGNITLVMER